MNFLATNVTKMLDHNNNDVVNQGYVVNKFL